MTSVAALAYVNSSLDGVCSSYIAKGMREPAVNIGLSKKEAVD